MLFSFAGQCCSWTFTQTPRHSSTQQVKWPVLQCKRRTTNTSPMEPVTNCPATPLRLHISHLPRDVMLIIFNKLTTKEITLDVLPVCKTWYDLGRDPILWKEMNIVMESYLYKSIESQINKVIVNARLLRHLKLHPCEGDVSRILRCIGWNCPFLQSLQLIFCTVSCHDSVKALVLGCPHINQLHLNEVSGSALNEFSNLKHLQELYLLRITDLTYHFFDRLASNSCHLEAVTLDGSYHFADNNMEKFFASLKGVLKEVTLFPENEDISKVLLHCTTLQNLHICSGGALTDQDFRVLENLQRLSNLTISGANNVSTNAWKIFICNVGSRNITSVCFNECFYLNEGVEVVLSLRTDTILHRATTIDMSVCLSITDGIVEAILKGNTVLEKFILFANHTLLGLAFNTADTNIAPALRTLDLYYCKQLNVSYLKKFHANRPGLTITYPEGEEVTM